MRAWCIQRRYDILFVLLMSCIVCHGISKSYGFYFPADEFCYWSYAAGLAGYDWSDIASLGSYYSYGYSLILLPVFLIFKDGVIAYRAAMVVNIALLAVCFLFGRRWEGHFTRRPRCFIPHGSFMRGRRLRRYCWSRSISPPACCY